MLQALHILFMECAIRGKRESVHTVTLKEPQNEKESHKVQSVCFHVLCLSLMTNLVATVFKLPIDMAVSGACNQMHHWLKIT